MQPAQRTTTLRLFTLLVVAFCTFLPTLHHSFVDLDDDLYVSLNAPVLGGISGDNVKWALTTTHGGYYIPLTWLSLQVDATLSHYPPEVLGSRMLMHGEGPLPAATVFHLTNTMQHALATVLLFLFLLHATKRPWPAFLAALLWAVHPLRAESVAWVTERKDTLAALFGFLALYLYTHYRDRPSMPRMLAVTAAAVASMLAKPLFVTLPLLLLILDYGPYGLFISRRSVLRLIGEKVHLFAIAAACGCITVRAQQSIGATELVPVSLFTRLTNVPLTYLHDLRLNIAPVHLSVFYPYNMQPSMLAALGAVLVLLLITALCAAARKRHPHLLWGWLWFVVASLPMVGLVQAGEQGNADRFTLLPSVGLFAMLTFSLPMARYFKPTLLAGAALAGVLAAFTLQRLTVWESSIPLLENALQTAPDNYALHYNLALAHMRNREYPAAADHFQRAADLNPEYPPSLFQAARAAMGMRDAPRAARLLERYMVRDPDNPDANDMLGLALVGEDHLSSAVPHFEAATRFAPGNPVYASHLAQARAVVPATTTSPGR